MTKEQDIGGMKFVANVNPFLLFKHFGDNFSAWPSKVSDPRVAVLLEENKRWKARA